MIRLVRLETETQDPKEIETIRSVEARINVALHRFLHNLTTCGLVTINLDTLTIGPNNSEDTLPVVLNIPNAKYIKEAKDE